MYSQRNIKKIVYMFRSRGPWIVDQCVAKRVKRKCKTSGQTAVCLTSVGLVCKFCCCWCHCLCSFKNCPGVYKQEGQSSYSPHTNWERPRWACGAVRLHQTWYLHLKSVFCTIMSWVYPCYCISFAVQII